MAPASPHARLVATSGVSTGSLITLITLFALDMLHTEPRVVVPIADMIVATAMHATGVTLRRLLAATALAALTLFDDATASSLSPNDATIGKCREVSVQILR